MISNQLDRQETMIDTATFVATTNEYRFYEGAIASFLTQNFQLPGADSQIFTFNRIKLFFSYEFAAADIAAISNLLINSALQIYINQREKLRIPLAECACFTLKKTVGNNATPPSVHAEIYFKEKKLRYPLGFNLKDNISVKLLLDTASVVSTALAATTARLELSGILTTRQTNEGWESVVQRLYPNIRLMQGWEILDYTIWDNAISLAAAAENNYFIQAVKTENQYSKFLPLSKNESFSVEAIQLIDTFTAIDLVTAMNERVSKIVKVIIDNTERLKLADFKLHELVGANTGTFSDAGPVNTAYASLYNVKGIKELEVSLQIPANSQVNVSVQQGALTGLGGGIMYNAVLLKGILKRRVN